jgi:uncharacterized protein (DUF2235 family)
VSNDDPGPVDDVKRRVVICCDGTWNFPDELAKAGGPAPTNVVKVAEGVARHDDEHDVQQLVYYQAGVGVVRKERFRGGIFGYGLSRHVRECYRFLIETYKPGDQLYFFGFSRGAYTARSVVGLIHYSGILRPEYRHRLNEAYRLYKSRRPNTRPDRITAKLFRRSYCYDSDDITIHFVGVWDTVGSMGIPIGEMWMPPFIKKKYGFHDTTLSPQVQNAYQALAIDERRRPFKPAVWTQAPGQNGRNVQQVWFAGAHRDVGGGNQDCSLSDIPLRWMVDRAAACGLKLRAGHFSEAEVPENMTEAQELEWELARAHGKRIRPDSDGLLNESYKSLSVYGLLGPTLRPLGAIWPLKAKNDEGWPAWGESVALTAIARLHESGGEPPHGGPWPYLAPKLRTWRADHEEAIDVLGNGAVIRPWPSQ